MVQCDTCEEWFHQTCKNIQDQILMKGNEYLQFLCSNCQSIENRSP
jgi:hypothetical protein